jgi:hypothetical protein
MPLTPQQKREIWFKGLPVVEQDDVLDLLEQMDDKQRKRAFTELDKNLSKMKGFEPLEQEYQPVEPEPVPPPEPTKSKVGPAAISQRRAAIAQRGMEQMGAGLAGFAYPMQRLLHITPSQQAQQAREQYPKTFFGPSRMAQRCHYPW